MKEDLKTPNWYLLYAFECECNGEIPMSYAHKAKHNVKTKGYDM